MERSPLVRVIPQQLITGAIEEEPTGEEEGELEKPYLRTLRTYCLITCFLHTGYVLQ